MLTASFVLFSFFMNGLMSIFNVAARVCIIAKHFCIDSLYFAAFLIVSVLSLCWNRTMFNDDSIVLRFSLLFVFFVASVMIFQS